MANIPVTAGTATAPVTPKTFDDVLAERITLLEAKPEMLSNKEIALLIQFKTYKKANP